MVKQAEKLSSMYPPLCQTLTALVVADDTVWLALNGGKGTHTLHAQTDVAEKCSTNTGSSPLEQGQLHKEEELQMWIVP